MHGRKSASEKNRPVPQGETAGCQATRLITAKLLAGQFAVGEMLNENRLAKELALNRTAIHEALLQLANINALEYVPFCGYRLKPVTLRDYLEWHEVRLAVEPLAARLAAERHKRGLLDDLKEILDRERECYANDDLRGACRCDNSFHIKMVECSGNSRLISVYMHASLGVLALINCAKAGQSDSTTFDGFNHAIGYGTPAEQQQSAHPEHSLLYDHLLFGRAEEAEALASLHVGRIVSKLKNFLVGKALEGYPIPNETASPGRQPLAEMLLEGLKGRATL